MYFLDLAMRLKRTLVLPRTRLLRRMGGGRRNYGGFDPVAEYVRWGELFNVSALAALHPVIELDEYIEAHGDRVDLVTRITHKPCEPRESERVDFNGRRGALVAGVHQCAPLLQHDHVALSAMRDTHRAIGFYDSVNQLALAPSLVLRPHVRFDERVYDEAAEYVRREFDGEPYIAVHWRRTDFLVARASQQGVLQPAGSVVAQVRALQAEHAVSHVYLATDSDDADELEHLRSELGVRRFAPPDAPARARDEGRGSELAAATRHANVEIAICAMASHFLGTQTSSFTLAITEERVAVFGHPTSTSSELRDPAAAARRKGSGSGRTASGEKPKAASSSDRKVAAPGGASVTKDEL